jgi:hypothetical protein
VAEEERAGRGRRTRGLDEILDLYVTPDEERDALSRTERPERRERAGRCWALVADPERPLLGALAIDLASAWTTFGLSVRLLSPHPRPALLPEPHGVLWETLDGSVDLEASLQAATSDRTLLWLPPLDLDLALSALPSTPEPVLHGVLLPIDDARSGLARGLAPLSRAPELHPGLTLTTVLVDGSSEPRDEEEDARVERVARDLGLELHALGRLRRDAATYRSLLSGVSVVHLDPNADSARDVCELARALDRI